MSSRKKGTYTFDYNLTIWLVTLGPTLHEISEFHHEKPQRMNHFHLLNEGVFQQILRGHKLYDTNPKLKMHCIFFSEEIPENLTIHFCIKFDSFPPKTIGNLM